MTTNQPQPADATRGEITLPIGGDTYTVRFGLRFLRAFTSQRGTDSPADALASLETAPIEALLDMITLGVKLAVPADKLPAGFDADALADVLDGLSPDAQQQVFAVLIDAIRANPIVRALQGVKA